MAILDAAELPLFRRIAKEATHLHQLGLSNAAIAKHLGVDDKTVAKAIQRALFLDSTPETGQLAEPEGC